MRKQLPWFEIALTVVVLGAYLYAALSDGYNLPNRWFIRDDAYYYFKVAQNISEGHGSTFDGIHPTNGYHPLWMLVCVPIFALARYDLILPLRVLVVVTGLLQAATFLMLYRLIKSAISTPVAMLAAAYWAFDTYVLVFLYKTGVESTLALFFIALLLWLMYRFEKSWRQAEARPRDVAVLAIVAALIVFSRLDLIFFGVIVGIWIVLRQSAMRYLLPLDIVAIFVATLAAFLARLGFGVYYEATTTALAMVIIGIAAKTVALYFLGLYQPPSSWKPIAYVVRLAAAVLIGSAVTAAVLLLLSAAHIIPAISRAVLLYDAIISLGLLLLIRTAAYLFRRADGTTAAAPMLQQLRSHGTTWLGEGGIYYGIVGGSLGLYMLWNKLAFGAFSPVSGEIKRWWGTFLISVYGGPAKTWLSFFGLDPYGEFNAWQPATNLLRDWSNALLYKEGSKFGNPTWQHNYSIVLAAALVLVVAILLVRRRSSTRIIMQTSMIPLFAGAWLQALSYNATGYASPKEWYWLIEPVLQVLVAALLLNVLFELISSKWTAARPILWVLAAVFAVGSAASYWRDALALYPYGHTPADTPYAEVIPFLREHTKAGDIIGMTGGGNVGYFLRDRTIVNMDGLINSPEYFKDLKAGTSAAYLYDSGMRYVFANPMILDANPYRGQFDARLEGIASWGGKDLMKLLPDPTE